MGAVQSEEVSNTLAEATTVINKSVVDVTSKSDLTCTASSVIDIETGGGKYCDFNAGYSNFTGVNDVKAHCQLNATNITKIDQNFKTSITNTITSTKNL